MRLRAQSKFGNFTLWFIISVFLFGGVMVYVYENFKYSRFSMSVDINVAKRYILARHVDLHDDSLRREIDSAGVTFDKRLSRYDFALAASKVLVPLSDGISRIEVVPRKKDPWLPMRFKLKDRKVIVTESLCEIPVGSEVLSLNGVPVEEIVEKYKGFFATLPDRQASYAFVDKMLHRYPALVGARTVRVVYVPPSATAQRATYVKPVNEEIQVNPIIEVSTDGAKTRLKINRFAIIERNDLELLDAIFKKIASDSTEASVTEIDLRGACDGDEAVVVKLISHLIEKPTELFPKLVGRHGDRSIVVQQIPVEPSDKIKGTVRFLFDDTCFYTPHKILAAFLLTNDVAEVAGDVSHVARNLYLGEFWKILPNTRTFLVVPQQKVEIPETQTEN